jgi:thymidylate synthase
MKEVGTDFDQVFKYMSSALRDSETVSPRGLKTKELINATMEIRNPQACVLTNPHRKLSLDYLEAEFDWYLSGSLTIEKIGEKASMWKRIANDDGTVNSNYGYFVFNQLVETRPGNDISQFRWCLGSLIKDQDSRQAVINFNQPSHKYDSNKDFVCTETMQFLIRDNRLISIVNMRSCDLIYGASFDIPWFSYVQQVMLSQLQMYMPSLQMGSLYHNSASLHVYERHFDMIEKIADGNYYTSSNLTDIPTINTALARTH